MNRLLGSSVNQYDVLGLAPDANDHDIDIAFDWLIRRKGFRHNMPLRQWPQRVREIKAAYATLRDPEKRRAYDETLREASDPLLWAGTGTAAATSSLIRQAKRRQPPKPAANESSIFGAGTDAATDALVEPSKRRQPPKPAANESGIAGAGADAAADPVVPRAKRRQPRKTAAKKSTMGAPIAHGSAAVAGAAAGSTESQFVGLGDVRQEDGSTGAGASDEHKPTGWEEEPQAGAETSDPSRDDVEAPHPERAAWAGTYRTSSSRSSVPAKNWGIAAAVTLAVGALFFASWPSEGPQPLRADKTQRSPGTAEQTSPPDSSPQLPPLAADSGSSSGESLTPEERAAIATDSAAASASLNDWTGSDRQATAEVPAQRNADKLAALQGQGQSSAAVVPTNTSGPAAREAPPQAGAAPAASAPTTAQAAPPAAAVPPSAVVARSNAGALTAPRPTATLRSSPPTLISGGPTDADNRRGRYRGAVAVQFNVGPEGRVSNCTVMRASGNPKLDALTCQILVERARFTPARDAAGRSVVSQAHATYVWGRGRRPKN